MTSFIIFSIFYILFTLYLTIQYPVTLSDYLSTLTELNNKLVILNIKQTNKYFWLIIKSILLIFLGNIYSILYIYISINNNIISYIFVLLGIVFLNILLYKLSNLYTINSNNQYINIINILIELYHILYTILIAILIIITLILFIIDNIYILYALLLFLLLGSIVIGINYFISEKSSIYDNYEKLLFLIAIYIIYLFGYCQNIYTNTYFISSLIFSTWYSQLLFNNYNFNNRSIINVSTTSNIISIRVFNFLISNISTIFSKIIFLFKISIYKNFVINYLYTVSDTTRFLDPDTYLNNLYDDYNNNLLILSF